MRNDLERLPLCTEVTRASGEAVKTTGDLRHHQRTTRPRDTDDVVVVDGWQGMDSDSSDYCLLQMGVTAPMLSSGLRASCILRFSRLAVLPTQTRELH